jgi:hypothetical protein
MIAFVIDVLCRVVAGAGRHWVHAFAAIEARPADPAIARLRAAAIACLAASSPLLVAAAIFWCWNPQGIPQFVCGWAGVVAFEAFLLLGNRCYRLDSDLRV